MCDSESRADNCCEEDDTELRNGIEGNSDEGTTTPIRANTTPGRQVRIRGVLQRPAPVIASLIAGDGDNGEIVIYEPYPGAGYRISIQLYQFADPSTVPPRTRFVPRLRTPNLSQNTINPNGHPATLTPTQYVKTQGLCLSPSNPITPRTLEACRFHPTAVVTKTIGGQRYTFRHQLPSPRRTETEPTAQVLNQSTIGDFNCGFSDVKLVKSSRRVALWEVLFPDDGASAFYIAKEFENQRSRINYEPTYFFLTNYEPECS